eukprot:scaffold1660_cov170-Skeletonema_dohrnii-CCMP3373.AAC.3
MSVATPAASSSLATAATNNTDRPPAILLDHARDKGMIITPNVDLKILKVDAFPDSAFADLYGYEDIHDPVVTRSRTGMVINVADSPVLWKSQQTASTMEAEVVTMASCCQELFPILCSSIGGEGRGGVLHLSPSQILL